MRRLLLFAFAAFVACDAPTKNGSAPGDEGEVEVTPRNTSITPENAYNNLFLDSSQIANFIRKKNLSQSMGDRMWSFYNSRNYQFAWLDTSGAVEQMAAFRSLYTYSKDSSGNKSLDRQIDALVDDDELHVSNTNPTIVNTELELTLRLINYFKEKKGSMSQLEHMIPAKKYPITELADSMLRTSDDVFPAVAPMKGALKSYIRYVKDGGWDTIASVKSLKKGQSSPQIPAIKRRLQITGELKDADSSTVFDDALETAVNTFRTTHGLSANGVINDSVIRQLNVPASERLGQIVANMERMKWIPETPEGRLILVNIPAFMLHVMDGKKKLFDMPIVVGKEGHSTTMFSGFLNQVVFSPYWNIPRSIVRKEILPAMDRNPNYLVSKNMEVTGESNGLPVIRQKPGEKNALGRVKFLFPNSYNIYFHDTPEKGLFERDNRAYSHGCIRLKDPVAMAKFVLEDAPEWTDEKIDEAMQSGKQKFVAVKHPVPVIITYYTAWMEDGALHFADDVYGHDAELLKKL
jgi:murein L,D-transpeptidase YcbB/YkuD